MQLSANLSLLFTELPLLERILAARVAGFAGVEIQFPYEVPAIRFKEALVRADLPLVVMNLPAGDFLCGGPGLAAVPQRQAEFAAALQEALTYAAMVRPLVVNVLPGRLAEGVMPEQAMSCLATNLRHAASEFAILNIGVVCEALNPLDVPGCLLNTPQQQLALLAQVDHANCRAQLDLYHLARQNLPIAESIHLLRGQIGHVQFADYPGRGAPGTGILNFPEAITALHKAQYDGWLGAEYKPAEQGTHASLGWLAGFSA